MLKKMSFILGIVLCMSALSSFVSAAVDKKPILIRFSHVVDENTPKGIGAKMFKELVETRLADKVKVVIYPRSQKFTDEQALLCLLFGDIEMAAPSFSKFRKFSRELQVFDLPFLFENIEEVHRFQQSEVGQKLLSSMKKKGIKGLTYWDNGMRVLSADRPLVKPSDLKGLTLRIEPSYIFQRQYAMLGAVATPMPFKQLSDALREGIVDGYENAWSNILSRELHRRRSHFTEVGHSYLGYMVVTSVSFWEKLPPGIQAEIKIILDEVTTVVNRLSMEKAENDKSVIMETSDVKIVTLNEKEKQVWKDAMLPVWNEFEPVIGAEVMTAARESKQQNMK